MGVIGRQSGSAGGATGYGDDVAATLQRLVTDRERDTPRRRSIFSGTAPYAPGVLDPGGNA
jgi:hypothetical protein